jgi:hypothetical protein
MGNLVLHLKKKYFDQIKAGDKTEEYREVKPYWVERLEGREYENIVLFMGYPKAEETDKCIVRPWTGYTRKTITHENFGTSPVEVFAIRL